MIDNDVNTLLVQKGAWTVDSNGSVELWDFFPSCCIGDDKIR